MSKISVRVRKSEVDMMKLMPDDKCVLGMCWKVRSESEDLTDRRNPNFWGNRKIG